MRAIMDASALNDFNNRLAAVAAEIEALLDRLLGAELAPFAAKADTLRAAARFIAERRS
jgi:hypothetical protein